MEYKCTKRLFQIPCIGILKSLELYIRHLNTELYPARCWKNMKNFYLTPEYITYSSNVALICHDRFKHYSFLISIINN